MASKLSLCNSVFRQTNKLTNFPIRSSSSNTLNRNVTASRSLKTVGSLKFTWDDVITISQSHTALREDNSCYLQPFFQRINTCNRGADKKSEFFPFVVDEQIVGYIHKEFSEHLRKFKDVFTFGKDTSHLFGRIEYHGVYVALHPSLNSPDDRTEAVEDVIKSLGESLIPGIRNELYPVKSAYGMPVCFSLERAAAPYFGIKAYGVHMNGYVEKEGEKSLWIGKRSELKPTFPGMLDHLVAGGLPHNMTCKENIIKECEEEAGIPRSISTAAVPVGAVSYTDIDGYCFKRDVLFCYDLKLTDGFIPNNQDGEVESFKLIPIEHVANIIHKTEYFKPNCSVVIIDFMLRHGVVTPDQAGYLQLLRSLRSGDLS